MRERPTTKAQLLPGNGPLAKVSPVVAFLVVAALFVVGVVLGGPVGAGLLGLLALALAALLVSTWGALHPTQRSGRLVVVLILVAIAVVVALR